MNPDPPTIAVRSVNWLGDAVMSTPALTRLRERFRDARILLLTPEKIAGLWSGHGTIDKVITFGSHERFSSITSRLRQEKIDLALILPNSFRSAAEMYFARIPRRVGYAGQLRSLLLTQAVHARPNAVSMQKKQRREIEGLIAKSKNPAKRVLPAEAHHIYQYLHLTAALGSSGEPLAPAIHVDGIEVTQACEKFGIQRDRTPLIGINAGAEYGPAKRWPIEYFIETMITLSQSIPCRFVLFGGKNDAETAAKMSSEISGTSQAGSCSIINVAGQTSLRELCALAKACQLFITNDTGPMHVAAAVGTVVVAPFGSTSAALTGPWPATRHHLLEADVPCSPCFLRQCPIDFRCMHQITPAKLLGGVLGELKSAAKN